MNSTDDHNETPSNELYPEYEATSRRARTMGLDTTFIGPDLIAVPLADMNRLLDSYEADGA